MKFFLLVFLLFSFSLSARSLSVMTYNVENLFDTKHDEGKKDWTYLPKVFKDNSFEVQSYCASLDNDYYRRSCLKVDWSESVLKAKISNLARVIRSYKNKGADIVILQEVENKLVLRELADELGYPHISLVEGLDSRGIDVGVLSRYPITKEKAHHLNLDPYSDRETRPILEVMVKVGKKNISLFGNHWPSQRNDDETRLIASAVLKEKALKAKGDLVILAGDFNTARNDLINGINQNLLPYFIDVEKQGRVQGNVKVSGTHWYRGTWDSLDKIFVRKDFHSKIQYSTYEIVYHQFMLKEFIWTQAQEESIVGVPKRYNYRDKTGYSDHLPVVIEFDL